MNLCAYCGHDEFVVVIPNIVMDLRVLGIDDSSLEDDDEIELEWRQEYLEDDYGVLNDVTIKCKACERVRTTSLKDLGLQKTEENMVSAYGID